MAMFGFLRFLCGIVVGLVAGFLITVGAMNHHFIRTDNSMAFVSKRYPSLADSYVDIRKWSISDWTDHPDLVYTLFKNDRQDLMPSIDGQIASLKRMFEK
jgi:hypothetical protein